MNKYVIFLDIDGVVTSLRTGWYNLDIYTIHFLRWVCHKTGAKIVISSTWRYNHDLDFWLPIFENYLHEDFRTPFNIDKNRYTEDKSRGCEIQAWLDNHPEVEKYLILDDDTDMLEQQMPCLIQTDSMDGMLSEQMMEIRDYWKIDDYPKDEVFIHQHENMFSKRNKK